MREELLKKRCVPCEGGALPFSQSDTIERLAEFPLWKPVGKTIEREFIFKNFAQALNFINKVGAIAEEEDHHPDINLHDYKKVTITLSTHAISGLSENDFILAAKIEAIIP
jgi:4a-hydroxytetrahydrobiopterin dehydratase